MYEIKENKGTYRTLTLYDTAEKSSFTINPERGGIVTEFSVDGIGDVLYMNEAIYKDPSKYIRGGIPVLFPMTGRLSGDTYRVQEQEYTMPVHGLARNYPWEIRSTSLTDSARIVVGLRSNSEMEKAFPFPFDVEFTYTLKGHSLTVNQCFKNLSGQDMPVSFGFHPYFRVREKMSAQVILAAGGYRDMVSGTMCPAEQIPDLTKEPEVGCLYLDVTGQKAVLRADGHRVEVTFGKHYRHVLLWSLAGEEFVCVEPWTAKPDALNTKEELIYMKPGECVRSFMEITVARENKSSERKKG